MQHRIHNACDQRDGCRFYVSCFCCVYCLFSIVREGVHPIVVSVTRAFVLLYSIPLVDIFLFDRMFVGAKFMLGGGGPVSVYRQGGIHA